MQDLALYEIHDGDGTAQNQGVSEIQANECVGARADRPAVAGVSTIVLVCHAQRNASRPSASLFSGC